MGDIAHGVVKTGYDNSLLAIRGLNAGGPASMLWLSPGSTAGHYFRPAAPDDASDTGITIGGSATGGAAWAGGRTDLFYAFSRASLTGPTGSTTYFAWQSGEDASQAQLLSVGTSSPSKGVEIRDIAFRKTPSGIEGWAVGQWSDTGNPFAAHLQ